MLAVQVSFSIRALIVVKNANVWYGMVSDRGDRGIRYICRTFEHAVFV
jgi:hypothetical protein